MKEFLGISEHDKVVTCDASDDLEYTIELRGKEYVCTKEMLFDALYNKPFDTFYTKEEAKLIKSKLEGLGINLSKLKHDEGYMADDIIELHCFDYKYNLKVCLQKDIARNIMEIIITNTKTNQKFYKNQIKEILLLKKDDRITFKL